MFERVVWATASGMPPRRLLKPARPGPGAPGVEVKCRGLSGHTDPAAGSAVGFRKAVAAVLTYTMKAEEVSVLESRKYLLKSTPPLSPQYTRRKGMWKDKCLRTKYQGLEYRKELAS